jgi:hypothetical protein
MAATKYIEQNFPIECFGRGKGREEVLKTPVHVKVKIYQVIGDEKNISSQVLECPHNTGSHGQRCKASHPYVDKIDEGITCPYSFDIPFAIDSKK